MLYEAGRLYCASRGELSENNSAFDIHALIESIARKKSGIPTTIRYIPRPGRMTVVLGDNVMRIV
jgi:hypothetical protein